MVLARAESELGQRTDWKAKRAESSGRSRGWVMGLTPQPQPAEVAYREGLLEQI